MKRMILLVASMALAMGCVVERSEVTPSPDEEQLRIVVRKSVQRMITDPDFKAMYGSLKKRAAKRGDNRPTITVDELECNVRGLSDYVLAPARDELKATLRKTQLFRVADGRQSETTDFGLSGSLSASGDRRHYYLTMRLVNYANDNEEVWNDFQKVGGE